MCEYIINIIADKELSGIDVHHIISKITRRPAAHNTGQLDSNVVAAVFETTPRFKDSQDQQQGPPQKPHQLLLLLSSAKPNLTQLPL